MLRFRHQHFGHQDGSGRGHDDGGQQVFRFDSVADISRHDAAGNVRHASSHDGHKLRARAFRKQRPNGERRFGLPHKNGSRYV